MSAPFRFSHPPNRAADIRWREWGPAAFAEAAAQQRPVLLHLTAQWCHWCHRMDETTYSDPAVIRLLNEELVPIRVDGDRYPHVQERYITAGWPTTAFLTPGGEVLWAGTYMETERLMQDAQGVLAAWRERRPEFEAEVERRRRALEATRARQELHGLVRREAADDVLTALRDGFDPRNGGFGEPPRFPQPDAIEFLYYVGSALGDASLADLADRTLDGMLAGELLDAPEGGFFRYALEADWTEPRREKLLDVNAGLLAAYSLGAVLRDRPDWAAVAHGIVEWVEGTLALADGLWGGSQAGDEEYFASDAATRRQLPRPPIDATVYTSTTARWIAALALAGGRLQQPQWIARADAALTRLATEMAAPSGLLYHYRDPGSTPELDILLVDGVEVARAALAVHQVTGSADALARARRLAHALEAKLWAPEGGFWERLHSPADLGALRYRERPFETNAAAARLLLDLNSATGERGWRAHAERILALHSHFAGRWGVAAAGFALAIEEFFEPPVRVVLAGGAHETAPLRAVALALPVPGLRVWSVAGGTHFDTLEIPVAPLPAAYLCTPRGRSPAITADVELGAALARLL